jgi:hypothetical protein
MSRNPLSKVAADPLTEICRLSIPLPGSSDQACQTLAHDVRRKMADIVLERIWDEGILHPDPGLPLMPQPIIREQAFHEVIKVLIMGELDVTTHIPRKTLLIHE